VRVRLTGWPLGRPTATRTAETGPYAAETAPGPPTITALSTDPGACRLTETDQPRERRDPLLDIQDAADTLCNPRPHAEPRYEWDANRHRRPLDPHRTVVPGLVQQLRDLAEPGVDGEAGSGGGLESCPVAIDAVSLLQSIEFGAAWRCQRQGLKRRADAEAHIRALVGVADQLDYDERQDLRRELRSWQHQAEVLAGWKTPARELLAPCMACDARGSLLARADGSAAWCTACGERWDEATVGVLARHVASYRARSAAAAREARARAVAERRRREGSATPAEAAA
jgi:hypothetical protein